MASSSDGDRPWQSYHTVYTNAKAGMDGVDKERVQRIVYEMSKGSKYFESEKRKEAFIQQKIENLRAQSAKLTNKDIARFQEIADKKIIELEASRDLSKVWLHSDMDAFYAAVETLENPSLKGKPMAVGSLSMLCTANYEARKFGVRAAMPGFIARKLCPDLIFIPTNFKKYTYYSELTRKVFCKYDPEFVATSLDEAYLNITDTCKKKGISGEEVADELRKAIFEETGLTCSAGVAPNRMLAKVCSDINKPNGQFILPNDRKAVITFISSLPIRKIGGIGKVTEHVLRDVLGINTCEDMLQKGALLCALFSQCSAEFFLSVGLGLGGTDTPQHKLRKSISSEQTFSATDDESLLFQKLGDIAEDLSKDMQKENLCGRTLTLKLKTAAFEVRTRAISLQKSIYSKEEILNYGSKLLKAELPVSLRLIGLRMSQFRDDSHYPLDPNQKTLTGFVISGEDVTRKFKHAENSTDLQMTDKQIILEGELNSSSGDGCCFLNDDNHFNVPVESDIMSESNQPMQPTDSSCSDACAINSVDDACPETSRPNNLLKIKRTTSCLKDKAVPFSHQKLLWVDDYICSVCGIEMPPSFIEERQEHLDYHLAKMLQEEESVNNRAHLTQQERLLQKASKARASNAVDPRKKQKSSPKDKKHIPIDAFFIKCKKNV